MYENLFLYQEESKNSLDILEKEINQIKENILKTKYDEGKEILMNDIFQNSKPLFSLIPQIKEIKIMFGNFYNDDGYDLTLKEIEYGIPFNEKILISEKESGQFITNSFYNPKNSGLIFIPKIYDYKYSENPEFEVLVWNRNQNKILEFFSEYVTSIRKKLYMYFEIDDTKIERESIFTIIVSPNKIEKKSDYY